VIERINGALSLPLWGWRQPETQVNGISSTLSAPARRKPMAYRIAGIDVHKKKLAVVVADVEVETNISLSDAGTVAILSSCGCCRSGSTSSRSKK
jgi:hypothetical protein